MTLSELESGRPAMEPERVSVRDAIEMALTTVESEARVRGVKLQCGEMDDLLVLGHKIRLEQALVNLLDNAVKFNRTGGEARIEAGETSDSKDLYHGLRHRQRHPVRRPAAHLRALLSRG